MKAINPVSQFLIFAMAHITIWKLNFSNWILFWYYVQGTPNLSGAQDDALHVYWRKSSLKISCCDWQCSKAYSNECFSFILLNIWVNDNLETQENIALMYNLLRHCDVTSFYIQWRRLQFFGKCTCTSMCAKRLRGLKELLSRRRFLMKIVETEVAKFFGHRNTCTFSCWG